MFRVFLFLHVLSTQSYYCLTSRLFHLPVSIVRYIHPNPNHLTLKGEGGGGGW